MNKQYNDRYENDRYEDEIDRMRARHSRGKKTAVHRKDRSRNDYGMEDQYNQRTIRHGRKKRKKKNPVLLLFLLMLLVVAAGVYIRRGMNQTGYWTIAVFGVDSRDGNMGKGALSDVEMLCSINRQTGEIRLASVFRDSYLRIDQEERYDKINEAYFLGGYAQAVKALEDNLDLDIDDYATFNWKAVIDAINVLGGVDLEITDKEFAYINAFITETVESTGVGSCHLEHSGMNHLDGVQAVAYARLRLMDTDFNRTERQRRVLGLAMEKAKQADANTLKTLVTVVFPQVSTSVGIDDLFGMAKNAKKYYIGQTSGFPFSHVEMKIGKKACVIPATLESNVIQLHSFLYDDNQYQVSGTVRQISSHIASESGIGEPGQDTESGKNVGAQSNTGNYDPSARQNAQIPASQPEAVSPEQNPPEQSRDDSANGEAVQETFVEQESSDMEESEGSLEESEITAGGPEAEEDSQSGTRPSAGADASNEVSEDDRNNIQPSSGSSGNQPLPQDPTSSSVHQPTGSLEAPGTNSNPALQPGPGTTGSGSGGSDNTGGPGASGSSGSGGGAVSPGSALEGPGQSGSGNGTVAGPGM